LGTWSYLFEGRVTVFLVALSGFPWGWTMPVLTGRPKGTPCR
jgi:hypothetical protein